MACKVLQFSLLILGTVLAGDAAQDERFHYDDATLRLGGLIFAGIMLTVGIIVLLSDFKLFKKKRREVTEVVREGQNS